MNNYHFKRVKDHITAWKNIGYFMKWGLEMSGRERMMQLYDEFIPAFSAIINPLSTIFADGLNAISNAYKKMIGEEYV